METALGRAGIEARKRGAGESDPSQSAADEYVFRLNLHTILSAHLYGHINEACAMRAIARAIQECLISHPAEYW